MCLLVCCFGCFIIFLIFFFLSFFYFFFSCCVAKKNIKKREKYLCDKEICLFAMPFIYILKKKKKKEKQRSRRRKKNVFDRLLLCMCVCMCFSFFGAVWAFFCSYYGFWATDVGRKSFSFIRSFWRKNTCLIEELNGIKRTDVTGHVPYKIHKKLHHAL